MRSIATPSRWERWPLVALLTLMTVGVIVAAVGGAMTSWDGGYFVYSVVDPQRLFIPEGRFVNIPMEVPLLLASKVIDDPDVLEAIFGISLGLVPIVVIVASALTVGWRSPLLVWPALGIGFGTIVSQTNATSAGLMATQLFWPALLAVLAGRPIRDSLFAVALAALAVVAHPFAIFILGCCAAVAYLRRARGWAGLLALGSVAGVLRLVVASSPYEHGQLTGALLGRALRDALADSHGMAAAAAVIGAALLVAGTWGDPSDPRRRWLAAGALGASAVAMATFVIWSISVESLTDTMYTRHALALLVFPFAAFAVLDSSRSRPHPADARLRGTIVVLAGATFAAVLLVHAVHWSRWSDAFESSLLSYPEPCVPYDALPHTPGLDYSEWHTTPYSIIVQGRNVTRVAEPPEVCASDALVDGVPITPTETRHYGAGWFDLESLRPPGSR